MNSFKVSPFGQYQSTLDMDLPDRGLIIRKCWLEMVLSNQKPWEMRCTKTKFRGRFALIESGSSLIRGEAYLIDSLDAIDQDQAMKTYHNHRVGDFKLLQKWCYPWVLSSVKQYDSPMAVIQPRGAVIWVKLNAGMIVGATSTFQE